MEYADMLLVERAAAAAGIAVERSSEINGALPTIRHANGTSSYWNPLVHRAQAFDLMVALQLEVIPRDDGSVDVERHTDGELAVTVSESGPDASAATMRAIVRAAAEVAR